MCGIAQLLQPELTGQKVTEPMDAVCQDHREIRRQNSASTCKQAPQGGQGVFSAVSASVPPTMAMLRNCLTPAETAAQTELRSAQMAME